MPFLRQRYEVRIKVHEVDQLLQAFVGIIPAVKMEAEQYYQRACGAWEAGDTAEWYVTPWTEVCLLGPDGHFERYVRKAEPDAHP
jgi:hypothetical protein